MNVRRLSFAGYLVALMALVWLAHGPATGPALAATVAPAAHDTPPLAAPAAQGIYLPVVARPGAVTPPPPPAGGFFIEPLPTIERSSAAPTVKVDGAGGVHVVFTPQSATPQNPTRPAYYAYCPANCAGPAAFTITPLGDGVDFAALALDPAGRPRLLLRAPVQSGSIFVYQYWACDGNCLSAGGWSSADIGYSYARQTGWVEPFIHSFALDPQGRPRFVYYDAGADGEDPHWGAFYAYCDGQCANAANWYETRLLDDAHATDFHLAFGPAGQPRLAYATYNSDTAAQQVAYAECDQACGAGGSWSGIVLADTASASVSHFATFSLAITTGGRPRLALYTGSGLGGSLTPNAMYYQACYAATCDQGGAWSASRLNLPAAQGEEGVALALDGRNRPRLAYHAPLADGFGLYYAWCDDNCGAVGGWASRLLESGEAANRQLPIPPWPGCPFPECNPPVPPCTFATWDVGLHPALALDPAGGPRVAYDAYHEQGGACGTFTDARLVRFLR